MAAPAPTIRRYQTNSEQFVDVMEISVRNQIVRRRADNGWVLYRSLYEALGKSRSRKAIASACTVQKSGEPQIRGTWITAEEALNTLNQCGLESSVAEPLRGFLQQALPALATTTGSLITSNPAESHIRSNSSVRAPTKRQAEQLDADSVHSSKRPHHTQQSSGIVPSSLSSSTSLLFPTSSSLIPSYGLGQLLAVNFTRPAHPAAHAASLLPRINDSVPNRNASFTSQDPLQLLQPTAFNQLANPMIRDNAPENLDRAKSTLERSQEKKKKADDNTAALSSAKFELKRPKDIHDDEDEEEDVQSPTLGWASTVENLMDLYFIQSRWG
ncbi:hypothetical protein C8F01DRAFT_576970 [Mycena amicta]|nr:hypothetical protein C8F01DRAFT_576970 [Mycena amicta]